MSCDVESGQRGVVTREILVPGAVVLHESPRAHSRRSSRDETPLTASTSCRCPMHLTASGGGGEVLP